MKIVRVTPYLSDRFLFVEIETDTGLVGTGECGAWGHLEAARAAIVKFGDCLVGEDPGRIELHWNRMQRFGWFRGAVAGGAVSAIDIALWDIKGQALGQPIHALLGGPARTSARLYAHVKAATKQEMVARCLERKQQGFTAIGHLNPFLDEERSVPYFKPHARKIADAVDVVAELRQALGDDVDLCVEIHRRLSPPEAIAFAREIAPFRPLFVEDPIAPTSADAMARVATAIDVPVATGERFATLHDFQAHVSANALRHARVSVCLCGGITGAVKVAALCEAFEVGVIPHNPLSPVSLFACLQLDAAIPNFVIQEVPTGKAPPGNGSDEQIGRSLRGWDLVDRLPQMAQGFAQIPTDPGLGVALSDKGRTAPAQTRTVSMRAHRDGFVVDQ